MKSLPRAMPPTDNSIRLQPDMEQLPALMGFLESFAETHGCSPADSMALALTGEELFANTVHHGETRVAGNSVQANIQLKVKSWLSPIAMLACLSTPPGTGHSCARSHGKCVCYAIGGLGLDFIGRTLQGMKYRREAGRNVTTTVWHLGAGSVAH